jgi:hypothetical protein
MRKKMGKQMRRNICTNLERVQRVFISYISATYSRPTSIGRENCFLEEAQE